MKGPLVYTDIDFMIAERITVESLRNVARINKTWRELIAENIHRMRQFEVVSLNIYFNPPEYFIIIFPSCKTMQISNLCKYRPTKCLDLFMYIRLSEKEREEVAAIINSIPSWWIKQIGKINCTVNDALFCSLLSQIRHITLLNIWERKCMKSMKQIIENTQQVDRFDFSFGNFDRSILTCMAEKSLIYPTEFPHVFAQMTFKMEDFIYCLENIIVPKHSMRHPKRVRLRGEEEDFLDWIRKNASFHTINESFLGVPHHSFIFRESCYRLAVSFSANPAIV